MSDNVKSCILVVDDEDFLRKSTSRLLENEGYTVVCAENGREAINLLAKERPSIIVSDIRMPVMDGIEMLAEMRTLGINTPVIMTTGFPDLESALKAMQNGAYDYVVKPYEPDMLIEKIKRAQAGFSLKAENVLLSRLASLHDQTRSMASLHNTEELISFTIDACMSILNCSGVSVYLKENETVNANPELLKSAGQETGFACGPHGTALSQLVADSGRSVIISRDRNLAQPVQSEIVIPEGMSVLSVPLKAAEGVIGVILLTRIGDIEPFGDVDLSIIEVFASQAGIAIRNSRLYTSLNQKIEELSLLGQYAEDLMKHLDRSDVIQCLFETVHRHFQLDIIGFLLPGKRAYEFLAWSRGIDGSETARICSDVVTEYRRLTGLSIHMKKVKIKDVPLSAPVSQSAGIRPVTFVHTIPLKWEDHYFGCAVFGACREPADASGIMSVLHSLVNQTRIAMANTRLYDDVKENYIRTIKALAIAVDAKDAYTHGHSENVMKIAEAIASEIRMGDKLIGIIRDAGLLHDIGKIGIPGSILNKPGPLTSEEFNGVMKTHATLGANIVKDVPFLHDLYFLILSHHEHFDGSGYPDGLHGEKIPLGARILHVADAFEAMTSDRPYRASLGRTEALRRLEEQKGRQFDPDVVDAFVRVAHKKGWL